MSAKNFLQDIVCYIPSAAIPALVGFVSIPILTHVFPPEIYGNYILVMATVSILSMLVGWINVSMVRYIPQSNEYGTFQELKSTLLFISAATILLLLSLYGVWLGIAYFFLPPNVFQLSVLGIGLIVILPLYEILLNFLVATRKATLYSIFISLKSLLPLLAGLILIFLIDQKIQIFVSGSIIGLAITLPFMWRVTFRTFPRNIRTLFSRSLAQEIFRYGMPLMGGNLAAIVLSISDRYMLEFFHGSLSVGVYSASYSLAEKTVFLVVNLFAIASGSVLVESWTKFGKEKTQTLLTKVTKYYIIVCLPLVVLLSTLSLPIVSFLLPEEYVVGYTVIPLVSAGAIFLGIAQRYQMAFVFYKKTFSVFYSILVAAVINVLLNIYFVQYFGYMGAAITTLISYVVMTLYIVLSSLRSLRWSFPWKTTARTLVGALLASYTSSLILQLFNFQLWLNITIHVAFFATFYALILIFLREITRNDVQFLLDFFGRKNIGKNV